MTLNRKRAYVVALVEASRLSFFKIERGMSTDLGQMPLADGPSRLDSAGDALVRRIIESGMPVVLRLDEDQGLVTFDTLPTSARGALKAVVGHRLDALTPWSAERAVFDAVETGSDGSGRIDVMIAAAPREALDDALAALERCGIAPAAADIVVNAPDEPNRLDFLREGVTAPASSPYRKIAAALVGVLVLVGAFFGFAWWRTEQVVTERREFAAALQERLADLPALHEQRDALKNQTGVIAERRRSQPSVALAIEELSRTLPDGVWLRQISIDGATMIITGYAPDAEVLLSLLEKAPAFSRAEFRNAIRPEDVMVDGLMEQADAFSIKATITLNGTELPLADGGIDP